MSRALTGRRALRSRPNRASRASPDTSATGTCSSNGYWLASANGNVADFGDAAPYGSMLGRALNAPMVGIAST